MNKITVSEQFYDGTPGMHLGLWRKVRTITLQNEAMILPFKIGEIVDEVFEECDEASADSHITSYNPEDFVHKSIPVKRLFPSA